jgi:hypothetical protein
MNSAIEDDHTLSWAGCERSCSWRWRLNKALALLLAATVPHSNTENSIVVLSSGLDPVITLETTGAFCEVGRGSGNEPSDKINVIMGY